MAVASILFAILVMVVVVISLAIKHNSADISGVSDISGIVSTDVSADESAQSVGVSDGVSDGASQTPSDVSVQESEPEVSKPEESETVPEGLAGFMTRAKYCYVINAKTGTVLYSELADERAYPASLTKLMTSIVALKYCDPDVIFTAGDEVSMIGEGSSIAYIKKGHRLKLSMLIDAMLLPSGNDAAYVVAVNVARSVSKDETMTNKQAVEYFAGLMNDVAEELGCKGTHFANPDGYHDDNHYTTASDISKICLYAMTFDQIRESASKEKAEVVYASGQTNTWYNSNLLLAQKTSSGDDSKWYKPYVTGLKTGMTTEAGSCIAVSAEKDGLSVIAVLMKCSTATERYSEAVRIMEAIYGTQE